MLVDDVLGRFVEAFLALPLVVTAIDRAVALGRSNLTLIIVIGVLFTPLIARTVRAAVLLERELDYVAAARLRGESALVHHVRRDPARTCCAPIMVEFTVRLGYAVFAIVDAVVPRASGSSRPSSDWGLEMATNYARSRPGYWWEVLFDALAIASLVSRST